MRKATGNHVTYPWAPTGIFSEGENILWEVKLEIESTGTNDGAENKNRTAKSSSILICSTFLMSF